jgi:hypothetical protein
MTPIILLAGPASSGKDTVGAYLATHYNAVTIGQADPMKRFVRDVFGFSINQLWGPSEARNAEAEFSDDEVDDFFRRFNQHDLQLIADVVPPEDRDNAIRLFDGWVAKIFKHAHENGNKLSARYVLQKLGTDWGRLVSRDMWSLYAIKVAKALLAGDASYSREHGLVPSVGTSYDYAVITDGRFRNELVNVLATNGLTVLVNRKVQALEGDLGKHKSETELADVPSHFYLERLENKKDFGYLYSLVDDMMAINYGDVRQVEFVLPEAEPNLQ